MQRDDVIGSWRIFLAPINEPYDPQLPLPQKRRPKAEKQGTLNLQNPKPPNINAVRPGLVSASLPTRHGEIKAIKLILGVLKLLASGSRWAVEDLCSLSVSRRQPHSNIATYPFAFLLALSLALTSDDREMQRSHNHFRKWTATKLLPNRACLYAQASQRKDPCACWRTLNPGP